MVGTIVQVPVEVFSTGCLVESNRALINDHSSRFILPFPRDVKCSLRIWSKTVGCRATSPGLTDFIIEIAGYVLVGSHGLKLAVVCLLSAASLHSRQY